MGAFGSRGTKSIAITSGKHGSWSSKLRGHLKLQASKRGKVGLGDILLLMGLAVI